MNKNLIHGTMALLFVLVVCISSAAAVDDTVTRDLPDSASAGASITVDLTVDVETGATYYGIDEIVPSGWTVTSATDDGDYTTTTGHVMWAVTAGAADKVYSYTVEVPADASGAYTFDGIYAFEGMTAEATILGDTTVIVGDVDTVTRDLSATADAGTTITVDLTVDVETGATYYGIDEIVPSGWTVTSATDDGDYTTTTGHVMWAVTAGAADKVYSYTVEVPADASGAYTFDGIYAFEGMTAEATILGDTELTVSAAAPTLASITISPTSCDLGVGGTQTFTAVCTGTDGSVMTPTLEWTSTDTAVGTITSAGVFTASAAGTADITASAEGKTSNTATVTVEPAVTIAIKAGDGSDLPDSIPVDETFTVLITEDGSPVGAGTNVTFTLPYGTGNPVYCSTDVDGKVNYMPLNTGTLGIRVLEGTVPVANATVDVVTEIPPSGGRGGGGGRGGTYPPGWGTTTTTATVTATAAPSPGATPGATPPELAPTPTKTAVAEETPSAVAEETPTKKPGIPGFTAVFAIAGLLAIAYAMMRRRE